MKVGKAIYNILSRAIPVQQNIGFSTDTFAPSGVELVTDGNFSAGTELAIALTSWTKYESGTSTVTYNGSTANLNTAYANDDVGIYQPGIFALGKSYKIVLNMKASSAFNAEVVESSGASTQQVIGEVSLTTSFQNFTFYYVGTGAFDLFIHRLGTGQGGPGSSSNINIQSVSVKKLGWNIQQPTGQIVSFNGTQAYIKYDSSATQGSTGINQSPFAQNKTYKIVLDIDSLTPVAGNKLRVQAAGVVTDFSTPGVKTFFITATDDSPLYIVRASNGTSFETYINSVSVQEMVLTKIFPEIAPPDINPPYIVYSVVSNQPSNTKNENGEIDEASLEVYSFQDTYNKTVDLGVAVRASLDRVNGTFATVKVDSINYTNEQMDVNESRKLWAAIQDYTVRIKNI